MGGGDWVFVNSLAYYLAMQWRAPSAVTHSAVSAAALAADERIFRVSQTGRNLR